MLAPDVVLTPPAVFAENPLAQMRAWMRSGERCCLVTLIGIEGRTPRPLGSQMAVGEGGAWVGQITSDCAEAAIAREALAVIASGMARTERFGRGSRFLDVRLPCGSGIDVHFDPAVPADVLDALVAARHERRCVSLAVPLRPGAESVAGHRVIAAPASRPGDQRLLDVDAHAFVRHYQPPTRLFIAGRGAHVPALVAMAAMLGFEVCLASPDAQLVAAHRDVCTCAQRLSTPDAIDTSPIDAFTASVLLFHDHDWEPQILARVLQHDGFYVGALGSRAAHAERLRALREMGVAEHVIARIKGPVGLDIGAQSPPEIALAVAAEIVAHRRGAA